MALIINTTDKTRIERLLENHKSEKTIVSRKMPSNSIGVDGDMAVGATSAGIKLFAKISGKWHSFTPDNVNSFENVMDNHKKKEYDVSNLVIDRDYNANGGDIAIVSDVLGTLIKDLSDLGIIKLKQ